MPLLTVGLPVYNAMPFLPETVNSLLAQSCRDFNIVIINDGSTDDGGAFLNSLSHPRIQIIHQKNQGLTNTLNRMLAEVQTPWLVRQDADDIAYPNRIECLTSYVRSYPGAGMYYSLADYHPKSSSVGSFRTTIASPEVLRNLTNAGYLLAICHPTVCLNVEKTRGLGGYRFDLNVEDIDLWWRMALAHDIRFVPEKLLGFRHNSRSVSQSNLEQQALNTLFIQYLLVSHLWGQQPQQYEKAISVLAAFLDRRQLKFRDCMRNANIDISGGNWLGGIMKMAAACAASPGTFAKRLAYEFSEDKAVVNGINPLLFALHSQEMWTDWF